MATPFSDGQTDVYPAAPDEDAHVRSTTGQGRFEIPANVPLGPPVAADPLNATGKGALVAALTEM